MQLAKEPVIKIEDTFVDKIMIKVSNLDEDFLKRLLSALIEGIITSCKMPKSVLAVKESNKVDMKKLPAGFDVEQIIKQGMNKANGTIIINKIGPLEVNLQMRLIRLEQSTVPHAKIEIDKYLFERDDVSRNLKVLVKEIVKNFS